jgi:NDP-sugar pyrophosphorylase family protein
MSKRAVVLAGGRGTRLRPYTIVLPKPLMPIGEYPILEVIVRQLAGQGFDHITLAVNHQANLIKAFFGDGGGWGVRIDYSIEAQPLSTIAPLLLIDDLPEAFLLMNGDVLTDLRFDELLQQHIVSGARFTIAAARRSQKIDYGVLRAADDGRLTGFEEKPSIDCLVSMGIYGVDRQVLTVVPEGRPYGFDDLMMALLSRGDEVRVLPYGGYWADIGRPEDYVDAIDAFESKRSALLPNG